MMERMIVLAKRPDLVLKLEKYGLIPEFKRKGSYEGFAKRLAKKKEPPYDRPEYQALAERLPTGWEELEEKEWRLLLSNLEKKIEEKKQESLDLPNIGAEIAFKNFVRSAFLGFFLFSQLVLEKGFGILPSIDAVEEKRARDFSFDLTLHFLGASGFLMQAFHAIAGTVKISEEDRYLIAELLVSILTLLGLQMAAGADEEKAEEYFLGFKHLFEGGIYRFGHLVRGKFEGKAFSDHIVDQALFFLNQLSMALERSDYKGFRESLDFGLKLIGVSFEQLLSEMQQMRELALNLHGMIDASQQEASKQKTILSQAM